MKKIKLLAVLAAVSTLFMGCPYSAEMALDEKPSVKIDEKILGKWEQKSSSDYAYTVTKEDDNTYKIEKKTVSSGDVTVYKGFLSDIGGTRYMNVWEAEATTKAYYFYKVEMTTSGSKITMAPVSENIDEKFTTSTEMKDFFKKNQLLSFFFEKEEDVYIKAD